MKATGIVRQLDTLGRIVIPKELREQFGLKQGTPIEIFVGGSDIVLRKYAPGCVFCGTMEEDMRSFDGKNVCGSCWEKLQN